MVNTCSKSTVKNLQQRLWISSSPKLAIPSSYFSHKFISKFEPAEGIFDIFVLTWNSRSPARHRHLLAQINNGNTRTICEICSS